MKRKMTISIIILTYLIFLWDCKITYSNKKNVCKIEYKGLLWVGLDYWSIWKYDSNSVHMKWIDWEWSVI